MIQHKSDCAVNNGPALPVGPCDCGAAATVVIVMRDPDASNEFRVFGPEPLIVDVDYGRVDLFDPEEFAEWEDGLFNVTSDVRAINPEAAAYIEGLVAAARERYQS